MTQQPDGVPSNQMEPPAPAEAQFLSAPATAPQTVKEQFNWTSPVGLWGPPAEIATGVDTYRRKRKPWGIRHVFYGLFVGLGLNAVVSVLAISLITARAGQNELTVEQINSQLSGLTTNVPFLIVSMLTLWVGLAGVPIWASYHNGERSLAKDFWFRFDWKRDILIGLGLAAVLRVVDVLLGVAGQAIGIPADDMSNSGFLTGQGAAATIALGLLAAVGAPIVEELFFRGLTLQAVMKKFGPVVAVIASSLLFGLMHAQPGKSGTFGAGSLFLIAVTGTLGAVFAIADLKTKRLGTSIWGHVFFNASGVLLVLFT